MTYAAAQGAVISVTRVSEAANAARRYKIYVDGVKVATLRTGKTIEIPVAPGAHRVVAKVDWCSSPESIVELAPGQRAALICGTVGNYYTMLANQLFRPGKYLALHPIAAHV